MNVCKTLPLAALLAVTCGCSSSPAPEDDELNGAIALVFAEQDDKAEIVRTIEATLDAQDSGYSLSELTDSGDDRENLIKLRHLAYDSVREGQIVPFRAHIWVRTEKPVQRIDVVSYAAGEGLGSDEYYLTALNAAGEYDWAESEEGMEPEEEQMLPEFAGGPLPGDEVMYLYELDVGGREEDSKADDRPVLLPKESLPVKLRLHFEGERSPREYDAQTEWKDGYSKSGRYAYEYVVHKPREGNDEQVVAVVQPRLELFQIYQLERMDRKSYGAAYANLTSALPPRKKEDPRAVRGRDGDLERYYLYRDLNLINVLFVDKVLPGGAEQTTLVRYGASTVQSRGMPRAYIALDRDGKDRLVLTDGGSAEFRFESLGGEEWRVAPNSRELLVEIPEEKRGRLRSVWIITETSSGRRAVRYPVDN